MSPYLQPFACFACRRSFRRAVHGPSERTCPHCGSTAVGLARKFKPPSRDDVEQWHKVELLYRHGFLFQTVQDETGRSVAYPETLEEAREFVHRYRPRARAGTVLSRRTKHDPPPEPLSVFLRPPRKRARALRRMAKK